MKENKNNKGLIVVLIISIVILCLCVVGDIVVNLKPADKCTSGTIETITKEQVTITDEGISASVNKVYDATVIVKISNGTSITGWGSGFVYKTDEKYGYILTNHHVVDKAKKILIEYSDEREVEGTLVGSDSYADVAIVKVPVDSVKKIAEIGKSEKLLVGDTVFAIGTPVNLSYKFTVTRGILSGKNRLVEMSSEDKYTSYFEKYKTSETWYMNLIQIDASINSGNSGGPLSNSNGEVVGITNSKLVSSATSGNIENIGFAIPIEYALSIAEKIETGKSLKRPVLGVTMTTINAAASAGITLSKDVTYGAVIQEVAADSNASRAGLKAGDVVISIGGKKCEDYKYLKYYLYNYSIGDTAEIEYIRSGKTHTTKITFKD